MKTHIKKILHYGYKLCTLPPRESMHKIKIKLQSKLKEWQKARAEKQENINTPLQPMPATIGDPLCSVDTIQYKEAVNTTAKLCSLWCAHRFDLLGSGWVCWDGNSPPVGVNGHIYTTAHTNALTHLPSAHKAETLRLRSLITQKDYAFIDWQRDVKSGFRFDEGHWAKQQPVGKHMGADIKIPWEIGRLQHLPQMAFTALASNDHTANMLAHEFRNQVLDFAAANPPRLGAQWACTMDVAIRAANMALAYTLFRQKEELEAIDMHFKREMGQILRRHGHYIAHNLEWWSVLTSNHYLSNVCGLAFVAASLEATSETDAWLAFAADQLNSEIDKQFYDDGVNFEGSTFYHRLSLEMALSAAALLSGLPLHRLERLQNISKKYLPEDPLLSTNWPQRLTSAIHKKSGTYLLEEHVWKKLHHAALFTAQMRKPDGSSPQLGDNDSGRFFRLTVEGHWISSLEAEQAYSNLQGYTQAIASYAQSNEPFFDENMLDHRGVIGMSAGLFKDPLLHEQGFALEASLIQSLHKNAPIPQFEKPTFAPRFCEAPVHSAPMHEEQYILYTAKQDIDLTENGAWLHYPDANIHIYRSKYVYALFNAGSNGQNGNGGHAHNDRLGIELTVCGQDIIKDSGTGLYTPHPTMRNAYRSTAAHFAPCPKGEEQNNFEKDGLFWMPDETKAGVLHTSAHEIKACLRLKTGLVIRRFSILPTSIIAVDTCTWQESVAFSTESFSPGYGKIER